MTLNWFEIVAQIINFFIIVFILQKLLYKPVLSAMAARQERIQKSQIEAEQKMTEAQSLIETYDLKFEDLQKEKREILEEARQEALEKKESLLVEYRLEADKKRQAYLKEIEDEKQRFTLNLSKKLGLSAVKIASHILDSLTSNTLDREVYDQFVLDLGGLHEAIPDFDPLKEETVDIRSFRELSAEEKKAIEETLRKQLDSIKSVTYTLDPQLVLGYEVNLETYTVHANIKYYLSEIENDILKNLETN